MQIPWRHRYLGAPDAGGEVRRCTVKHDPPTTTKVAAPGVRNKARYVADDTMCPVRCRRERTMLRVGDIGAAVEELTKGGVEFERYDGMDQDERGITRGGGAFIAAWFKDPAGNILEVLQER
jgi:hypothetical protein